MRNQQLVDAFESVSADAAAKARMWAVIEAAFDEAFAGEADGVVGSSEVGCVGDSQIAGEMVAGQLDGDKSAVEELGHDAAGEEMPAPRREDFVVTPGARRKEKKFALPAVAAALVVALGMGTGVAALTGSLFGKETAFDAASKSEGDASTESTTLYSSFLASGTGVAGTTADNGGALSLSDITLQGLGTGNRLLMGGNLFGKNDLEFDGTTNTSFDNLVFYDETGLAYDRQALVITFVEGTRPQEQIALYCKYGLEVAFTLDNTGAVVVLVAEELSQEALAELKEKIAAEPYVCEVLYDYLGEDQAL